MSVKPSDPVDGIVIHGSDPAKTSQPLPALSPPTAGSQFVLTFEEGGRLFTVEHITRFEIAVQQNTGGGPNRGPDKGSIKILDMHQRLFPITGQLDLTEAQIVLERIFALLVDGKSIRVDTLLAERRAEIFARNQKES